MTKQINLFSNQSSLILKQLLLNPRRKWVVRDFLSNGVSLGQANKTLNRAEELGYVVRVRRGRNSYLQLKSAKASSQLLADWARFYSFSQNHQVLLFCQGGNIVKHLDEFMKRRGIRYAFTAFSASRLISPYVMDQSNYIYLDLKPSELNDVVRQLVSQLGLLKLAEGGNLRIAVPYYRSEFRHVKVLKGYPVGSNIQLYLDLMGLPGGPDEIRNLKEYFKRRGEEFV